MIERTGPTIVDGVATSPGSASVTIDSLRARCVEETRSGAAFNDPAASACQQFAEASRASLPPVQSAPRLPRTQAGPSRPQAQSSNDPLFVEIPLANCEGKHGYGTISYRQCRANEAERLRQACIDTNKRLEQARGAHRQNLRVWARSYCREANRYRVTD